ncbi:MAG: CDP-glycerol glycerophosphotransferase family protein [Lachnospiraceae bacterium]|nr:CDP-glycerol glycerophosphotransferase family protein [Lachnospiraceae bacterium]
MQMILQSAKWERIFLHLTLRPEGFEQPMDSLSFYFVNEKDGGCKGSLYVTDISREQISLTFNIADRGDGRCLSNGNYRIAVCREDALLCFVTSVRENLSIQATMKDFPYQKEGHYSSLLTVTEGGYIELGILDDPGPETLKKKAFRLKKGYYNRAYRRFLSQKEKAEEKTILFLTEMNEKPGENLTCVKDRLWQRQNEGTLDQKYRILESARNSLGKKYTAKSDLDLIRTIAQSDILVVDDHIPMLDWLAISRKTEVIQLWHAGVGFKATGYSRWGHKGAVAPFCAHRFITHATVASDQVRDIFSELWGIDSSKVIPCGIPRMDRLMKEDNRKKFREKMLQKYPALSGKKVILFAPTYRGRGRNDASYPMDMLDLPALAQAAKSAGYAVLFKMHPWISEEILIDEKYREDLLIADPEDPIETLFPGTDLLITDYSSALFEYSVFQKPMLFFAFDEETYAHDRGFHRPYRENAPGKVVSDFDSLLSAIRKEDFEQEKVEAYVKRHFDRLDDGATDRVIDWLIEGNMPEEYRERERAYRETCERRKRLRFSLQTEGGKA